VARPILALLAFAWTYQERGRNLGRGTSSDQSWNIETSFLALVMDGDKLVTPFLYSRSLAVKR
jgi:hypothetical protein